MRDDKAGFSFAKDVQALLDLLFRDTVKGGGRFVQDQNGRILEEDPRDGDSLFLAAGEDDAALADVGLVAVGHLQDVLVDPGPDGSFHNFAVRRIGAAVADVFHDGVCEQEDVLLNDTDAAAKARLGQIADVVSVDRYTPACDVVEAGDQVAHGSLAAAGTADKRNGLAGRDMQIHVVEDLCSVIIGERDVLKADVAFYVGQYFGIRGVLDLGLCAHELHEAVKTCHALGIDLHELHQLADRGGKSGDVERKGDQIDITEPVLHDQKAAEGNDGDLHQADSCFNPCVEQAHRAVEGNPAGLEGLVRRRKFLVLSCFVGESLGSADAGDPALNSCIDFARALLDLTVSGLHVEALAHAEDDADGEHDDENERQQRVDRQKDDQSSDDRQGAGQDILRAVVRELHDLEKVVGDAREQNAGPVAVEEAVGELLHVGEHVSSHVRLDEGAHPVPDHRDKILTDRTDQIRREHDQHDGEKGPEKTFGQEIAHGPARHIREEKVHGRDADGKRHVDGKGLAVRLDIRSEDRQFGTRIIDVHENLISLFRCGSGYLLMIVADLGG